MNKFLTSALFVACMGLPLTIGAGCPEMLHDGNTIERNIGDRMKDTATKKQMICVSGKYYGTDWVEEIEENADRLPCKQRNENFPCKDGTWCAAGNWYGSECVDPNKTDPNRFTCAQRGVKFPCRSPSGNTITCTPTEYGSKCCFLKSDCP
jgi:hypothetical protein